MVLKIFLLFILFELIFSLKSNIFNNNVKNRMKFRFLNFIQNTPVENNIPIIVQDINNNDNPKHKANINLNPIPIHIPIISDGNNKVKIITNTSIKINTTKMDPMCTPECCMGCRVQFQKLIMQKNCITNVCKCQIIEINSEKINENIEINDDIKVEKIIFLLNNKKDKKIDMENIENDSSHSYYLIILFIFVIYELSIIYKFISKRKENDDDNTKSFKREKEKRLKDYIDLVNDDEELIECLI